MIGWIIPAGEGGIGFIAGILSTLIGIYVVAMYFDRQNSRPWIDKRNG